MTKSPNNQTSFHNKFVIGASLVGLLFAYGRRIYASCHPGTDSGSYVCSGANTTGIYLYGTYNPLAVTTTSGFSVVSDSGYALYLLGNLGLSFTDNFKSTISGYYDGINARNQSTGDLIITSTGAISGGTRYGIYARNDNNTDSLTITAADVSGGRSGIYAQNQGTGDLIITSTGAVLGRNRFGIFALNSNTTTGNITITVADVSGGRSGIDAQNQGTGDLIITSTGAVLGRNRSGIVARNYNNAGSLTITAADVSGGGSGIYATNLGSELLSITTNGMVTGEAGSGVSANGNLITINVENGSVVSGQTQAISSTGSVAQPSTIVNNGLIQNLSTSSADLAIVTNGIQTITNENTLNGTVLLQGNTNTLINNATWNTAGGDNQFSLTGTNNQLINNGTIHAANAGATSTTTTSFLGLTSFQNSGIISLQNDMVGNQLVITGNFTSSGNGQIKLNTTLGTDNSPTDLIVLDGGATSGTTRLIISNAGGNGGNTTGDGIMVVSVENNGTTTSNAFQLGKRVAQGAYEYKLYQGAASQDSTAPVGPGLMASATPAMSLSQSWFLRSTSYRDEVPLSMTAPVLAQQFGLIMVDTLDDRVGTKVFDAKGTDKNGAWARVIGETGKRNPRGNFPNYHWNIGGFQLGYDLYRRTHRDNSSDVVGADVGYAQVNAGVQNITNSAKAGDMRVNGVAFGAYWTHYGSSGWYSDAVFQGTDYENVVAKSAPGGGFSTRGSGYLGSLEGGWVLKPTHGVFFTPEAQLVYQKVAVSNTADSFGLYRFDNADALIGRVGGRVSQNWAISDKFSQFTTWARINVWHDFNPQSNVAILSLAGTNPVVLPTNYGENWAQFSLGASSQLHNGASIFASGDYSKFFAGMQGNTWGGRVGVKYVT